ncbi:hypothetical protein [Pedobacter aquatilis]|uniref:hypothetical protein n=1 Tax=Pedobacter aquatilis TaxID=351343 RepID=UPI0029304815|nr:hypothetical protein [Pedobacter aquatilis]
MEALAKLNLLKSFLKKIQCLQGYGDMNSYVIAYEYKQLTKTQDNKVDKIIDAFSSPRTWYAGKVKFIDVIETHIGDIYNL